MLDSSAACAAFALLRSERSSRWPLASVGLGRPVARPLAFASRNSLFTLLSIHGTGLEAWANGVGHGEVSAAVGVARWRGRASVV